VTLDGSRQQVGIVSIAIDRARNLIYGASQPTGRSTTPYVNGGRMPGG
jgi:hypothetical protein